MKKIFAMSLAAVLSLSLLAVPGKSRTERLLVVKLGGPAGGKPAPKVEVNFEGRVAAVEDGKVTLEDGTVILTDGADIAAPDGSAGKISAGDYIQGYAEDPDAAELNATAILITVL